MNTLAIQPKPRVHPAIIGLAVYLVALGAVPGPFIWIANAATIPLIVVAMIRFPWLGDFVPVLRRQDMVHLRIALYAVWCGALLHAVVRR